MALFILHSAVTFAAQKLEQSEYLDIITELRPKMKEDVEQVAKELNILTKNYDLSNVQKADIYLKLSNIAYILDDSKNIIKYADLSIEHINNPENHDYYPSLLLNKAYAYGVMRDPKLIDTAHEALRVSRLQEDKETQLHAHSVLIEHYIRTLQLNEAHRHTVLSLRLAQIVGNTEYIANGMMFEGMIFKEMEDYKNALKSLLEAESLYKDISFYHNLFHVQTLIAETHIALGNMAQAEAIYTQVVQNENANDLYLLCSNIGLAKLYIQKDLLEQAMRKIQLSERYLQSVDDVATKMQWYITKAEALAKLNKTEDAASLIEDIYTSRYFNFTKANSEIVGQLALLKSIIFEKERNYQESLNEYKKFHEINTQSRHKKSDILFREIREKHLSNKKDQELAEMEKRLAIEEIKAKNKEREVFLQRMVTALCILFFIVVLYALIKQTIIKRQLSLMINTDALTNVPNRYCLMKKGEYYFESRNTSSNSMSVILLDIDNFKTINDTFGHSTGDEVLKEIAKLGSDSVRAGDWFGRLGGEEFVAILPKACAEDGRMVAERIRKAISSHHWDKVGIDYQVTASIGVASADITGSDNVTSFNTLLNLADKEMYKAKKSGKNRVFVKK